MFPVFFFNPIILVNIFWCETMRVQGSKVPLVSFLSTPLCDDHFLPKYEKEYFKNAGQDWNYLSLSTRQGYEGTLPGLFISSW